MKRNLFIILGVVIVVFSLGCGTIKEIRVSDFDMEWELDEHTVTLTCEVCNSFDEAKQVSIRGWFDIHGDNPLYLVEGPATYNLPPPDESFGIELPIEVEFVLTEVPEFTSACWGFDWAEGIVDPEAGYDAYTDHYEEEYPR